MVPPVPPRFSRPSILSWVLLVVFGAMFVAGIQGAEVNSERLWRGVLNMGTFLAEAVPPDFRRLEFIAKAMLETVNMAVVGVAFGVVLSLPMALLCARNITPQSWIRVPARMVVATLRTIPDLIWALIFVVAVGLGPLAGILAIIMDTIGFCARFFAERIEEVDPRPSRALVAIGASNTAVVGGAILPECLPSFTGTSLFAVEKAVRSAVVLGLVGAGGIGVELTSAMNLFRFQEAAAIILVILVVVIAVEQVTAVVRRRVM